MFRVRAFLITAILACFDLTLTAASFFFILGGEVRYGGRRLVWLGEISSQQILTLAWILAVWLALLSYFGMYQSRRTDSAFVDLRILAKAAIASLIVLEGIAHLFPKIEPARLFLLRFGITNFIVLCAARIAVRLMLREVRRRGYNTKNLLLITSPEMSERLESKIRQRGHYGYHILKTIVCRGSENGKNQRILPQFRDCLRSARVDDVILALPSDARDLSALLVAECENHGVNVRVVPDLFPLIQSDTQVYNLDGIPLINVHLYPTEYFGYVILKRLFDIAVSVSVLVLLFPLCLLIAALIKLTSAGPVFFIQERVGMNGKRFKMLKFRTMYHQPEQTSRLHWTTRNDPNVTPLGCWLRRSNLDELPQLLNVLEGDMSIVGPRPERPFFIERFRQEIPEYMLRQYVKSGITGWAQVNGWRGDTSIRNRVAHDLYYVQNWGLGFDIKILFLTLTKTFFHPNAY